jgi:hypothetical protein
LVWKLGTGLGGLVWEKLALSQNWLLYFNVLLLIILQGV